MILFIYLFVHVIFFVPPFEGHVITLHDGSPLFGRELYAANGKIVSEFLGIPFAEPPVGNLRFRKPKPNQPWRKPLNATRMPNACIQSLDTTLGDFYGAAMWNSNVPVSEDCLYLNVHVPGEVKRNSKLPVMVWVYGGGYWSGCISLDVYDPKILTSEENVIFVAMNYRVSVFGFLYMAREEAPGNMGLWDQLLAVQWVHKNIDLFGGDPSQVTLFGESAGATAVSMHLLSPKSAPYFKRAIIQSGSPTAPWGLKSRNIAIARSVALYEDMRCGNMSKNPQQWDLDEVLRCLLDAPAEAIRDSEWVSVMEFADFPWVPVIDGDLLIEQPKTSLKEGNFKKTDLLVGSNFDEAIYFIVYQLSEVFPPQELLTNKSFTMNHETWLRSISNLLPRYMLNEPLALASIIHEYEPADLPISDHDWINSLDKMLGDFLFTCNVNELGLANAIHGDRSYYYYFTHRSSQQTWPKWMGVVHGYEINFIFGEPLNTKTFKYTKEEQELSLRFMRYWANFARTGDPNRNVDGTYTIDVWPPYTPETMEYMNLTVESDYLIGASRIGTGPRRKQCSFWKNLLPNLMTAIADTNKQVMRWKEEMYRWENEYIVDWQLHFEQYKKYQSYRYADSEQSDHCSSGTRI